MAIKNTIISVPLFLISLGSTSLCAAEKWDNGIDIRIGAMSANNSSSIRLNSSDLDIGIEDNLQLEEDITTGRLGFAWRFKDRHSISIDAYRLHRDGIKSAEGDFNFYTEGGKFVEVKANAGIESKLNFDIYDITYGYSFIKSEKHHLSALAGLYWMDIGLGIKASGNGEIYVDGAPVSGSAVLDETASIGAPMPLIGIQYDYAISPQWTANINARYFGITVDPYDGSIANIDLSTSYYFSNFFIGAGYTWVDIDIGINDNDWNGGLAWRIKGPHVFAGTHF